MRTLNVRRVTLNELAKQWAMDIADIMHVGPKPYVRCNSKGIINWSAKTLVYKSSELEGRKVKIF